MSCSVWFSESYRHYLMLTETCFIAFITSDSYVTQLLHLKLIFILLILNIMDSGDSDQAVLLNVLTLTSIAV